MRLLHTADWHVGKTIRGHSRAAEHRAVLAEIASIAAEHQVQVVIVAGDLFDTASPAPESEQIVYDALLALRSRGVTVVVVAGNHDSPNRLRAVAPLFHQLQVRVLAQPSRPEHGGVLDLDIPGTPGARVALVPFLSQRGIVRAGDLMLGDGADHALLYADRYRRIVEQLCAASAGDRVSLVVAHAFVANGLLGGGERSAHTIFDYSVPATVFPPSVQYVALGHLHRAQRMDGPTQVHYSGSPLQLDFGEGRDVKQVNIVDLEPGRPAKVQAVMLRSGRPLRTLRGSFEELRAVAAEGVDPLDYLRVVVRDVARAGLADQVRELLPGAVDIVVERTDAGGTGPARPSRTGLTPHELFAAFCAERGHDDPRVRALFAELLEESGAAASG